MKNLEEWNIIDVYSRKDAISDGVQVLANPKLTTESGIKFPVYLTEKVYNKYVKVPEGMDKFQNEESRLWDIFTMFKHFARGVDSDFIEFKVSVTLQPRGDWTPNERREGPDDPQRLVTLKAVIGPMDFDDPSPAITIMMPGED